MIDSSCICWTAGVWRCDGKSGIWPRRTTEIHSLRTSAATRYRTRSGTDLSLTPILQFNRRKISVDAPASWPKLIPVKQQYKAIILGRTERQFRKALCFSRDVFLKFATEFPSSFGHRRETLPRGRYMTGFYDAVQNFGGCPLKIWDQKRAEFGAILHNFRLWSRIFPELSQDIQIGKACDQERFFPRSAIEVRWTLVH